MWKWIEGSLQRKLSVLMLVVVIIPIVFLGVFSYVVASNIAEEKAEISGLDTLREIQTSLNFIIQDVENMSVFIIGDRNVQKYLSDQQAIDRSIITGSLMNLVNAKDYISDITIHTNDGSSSLSTSSIYGTDLMPISKIIQTHLKDQRKWWSPLYTIHTSAGYEQVISLIRPIRDINSFEVIGTLVISIDHRELTRSITRSSLGNKGYILVLDENDDIIIGKEPKWLLRPITELLPGINSNLDNAGTQTFGTGDEKKTVLYSLLANPDWKILGVIPYDEYTSGNRYILFLTVLAVGIAILLIIFSVLFLIGKITKPIRSLASLLRKVNIDKPLPLYQAASDDEIGQLVYSYNLLGNRIELLKEQVKENEAHKKEADLRVLQAQINPHFLYNTLGSIHWMALMNGDQKTSDMVESLGQFLRFSLNKGKDYCTVQQEIAHIKSYLTIQEIRFPDTFTFECLVDDEVEEYMMLKLLLQPLVENSLIHGIQKKHEKGIISVQIELDYQDRLKFTVQDTGIGMKEDKVEELQRQMELPLEESLKIGTSYGLRNVHERLRLHYGEQSSIMIQSVYGVGTKVSFVIPTKGGTT